jgi:hypothetical protein
MKCHEAVVIRDGPGFFLAFAGTVLGGERATEALLVSCKGRKRRCSMWPQLA